MLRTGNTFPQKMLRTGNTFAFSLPVSPYLFSQNTRVLFRPMKGR